MVEVWRFRGFYADAGKWSNSSLGRCALERGTWKGAHLSETSRNRNGASLSEEAQCGGPLERAPLLGTLEYMLRKAPDTGICFYRVPSTSEGNLESGVASYTGDFE